MKDYTKIREDFKMKLPVVIKNLRKQILKDWGKRCDYFCMDCSVCQVHLALTILEQRYDFVVDGKLWGKKKNKGK